MTDPIRPDTGPPADEAAAASQPAEPEAPETPETPGAPAAPAAPAQPEADAASTEPVVDPSLAALVAADTAEEPAMGTAPAPAEPPSAPPPAAPPVPPVPQAAPPTVTPTPAPVVVQQPVAPAPRRRSGLSTVRRVIAFLFGILQALLILRIVLLLLNADPDNDIVSAILSITQPFVDPFMGIFQLDSVTGGNGSVLDIAAIVALIAWTLIETLIVSLLRLFDRPAR